MKKTTRRERFHRRRVVFWAVQIPPAVWIAMERPEWERGLFAYLVVISLAALVESSATDWDQARAERLRQSSSGAAESKSTSLRP